MSTSQCERAVALIDGMNLFFNAKDAFGHRYPNYDVVKLAEAVARQLGCSLIQTRFYVGVPRQNFAPDKHYFWVAKSEAMKQSGAIVYTRPLTRRRPPQEKGIDLRIGLDALSLAYQGLYDTLIIFSTDQDFTEVPDYVRQVPGLQGRAVRFVSAFPAVEDSRIRGINGFEHFRIPQRIYDACLDPKDYRGRRRRRGKSG